MTMPWRQASKRQYSIDTVLFPGFGLLPKWTICCLFSPTFWADYLSIASGASEKWLPSIYLLRAERAKNGYHLSIYCERSEQKAKNRYSLRPYSECTWAR